jgi:hypothetical protein
MKKIVQWGVSAYIVSIIIKSKRMKWVEHGGNEKVVWNFDR